MIVAHPARIDASSSRGGRGDAHNELRRRPTGRSRGMRAERFVPKQARVQPRRARVRSARVQNNICSAMPGSGAARV